MDIDGLPDAALCTTWIPRHFDACAIPPPSQPLDLTGDWTFDTDTGMLTPSVGVAIMPAGTKITQAGGIDAYVVSLEGLAIEANGTLRVIGSMPLIVASWQQIQIAGSIDAGSTPAQPGAGANPASECDLALVTSAQPGQIAVSTGGSGGGGGGAFGGRGGHGGIGDNPQGPLGGAGGAVRAAPTIVIGGCSGAPSGQAGPGDTGDPTAVSVAGIGGGALQLTARVSITITGRVLASGGGGGGAPAGSAAGGGGGGGGGFLGFDAPAIGWNGATIAANGGGGGSSGPFAGVGVVGQDGQPSATQAAGGTATSCAEAGMVGGADITPDGADSTNPLYSCGGAGGGGGVGFVLTWGDLATTGSPMISPPAQPGG